MAFQIDEKNRAQVKNLTFDGGEIYAAGLFGQNCRFPAMNLVGRCRNQVTQNMPMFIGRLHDGTIQPVITGQGYTITDATDDCEAGLIETDLVGCEWIVPSQAEIDLGTQFNSWKKLWRKFCQTRGLASTCPPPFKGDQFNSDDNLAEPFLAYLMNSHAAGLMHHLEKNVFYNGDIAKPLQATGFYTQVDNGWQIASGTCDEYNVGVEVDWAALTAGSVDCDGVANAGYTGATIAGGSTVPFWGGTFDVGGLGLGEFLAHYLDAVDDYVATLGGNAQWELHVPKGYRNCLVSAVSCMRVCCNAEQDVSETNARYASLRRQQIIELYPFRDEQIPILENPEITDGCIRLVPREVGGCATYGIVAEDVGEIMEELESIGGFGFAAGLPNTETTDLIAQTSEMIGENFESTAFATSIEKKGTKCLKVATSTCFTPVAYHRCLWLKICNVECQTMQKPVNSKDGTKE